MRALCDYTTNEILQVEKTPELGTSVPEGRVLGVLCYRGHDFAGTGSSLRYRSGACVECSRAKAKKQARKETVARRLNTVRETLEEEILLVLHGDDPKRYRLGALCPGEHDYHGSGRSLRSRTTGDCPECSKGRAAAWRVSLDAEGRDQVRRYFRERERRLYRDDEQFAMSSRLRSRFRNAMKLYTETGKVMTSKEYGIDYRAIIDHLGPCPGDRVEYHIDHIRPLCDFDLNDPCQVQEAMSPENFQWLLADDNLAKGRKAA